MDGEGKNYIILNKVILHNVGPDAVPITDIHYDTNNGFNQCEIIKCIWEVCVQWTYRSTDFVSTKGINICILYNCLSIPLGPKPNLNL